MPLGAVMAHVHRQGGGQAAAAHMRLRIAICTRRDEHRHALVVPILSRQYERRAAFLRSGERPRVMAERQRETAQRSRRMPAAAAAKENAKKGSAAGCRMWGMAITRLWRWAALLIAIAFRIASSKAVGNAKWRCWGCRMNGSGNRDFEGA